LVMTWMYQRACHVRSLPPIPTTFRWTRRKNAYYDRGSHPAKEPEGFA
jgi:hypothetical protein